MYFTLDLTFLDCFIAWWCHCYIYGRMPCQLIHPGLWVMSSVVLELHQSFRKMYRESSNKSHLLLNTSFAGPLMSVVETSPTNRIFHPLSISLLLPKKSCFDQKHHFLISVNVKLDIDLNLTFKWCFIWLNPMVQRLNFPY